MGTKSSSPYAASQRERFLKQKLSVPDCSECDDWRYSGAGTPRNLRRRAWLGNLCANGIRPQIMGYTVGSWTTSRHACRRLQGYRVAASRKRLSLLERGYQLR